MSIDLQTHVVEAKRRKAAVKTLEALGYSWRGGETWVPPDRPPQLAQATIDAMAAGIEMLCAAPAMGSKSGVVVIGGGSGGPKPQPPKAA